MNSFTVATLVHCYRKIICNITSPSLQEWDAGMDRNGVEDLKATSVNACLHCGILNLVLNGNRCPQCVHWSSGSGATLCAVSAWQFNPWFDGNLSSHWSHLKDSTSASIAENGREVWEITGGRLIGFGMFTFGEDSTFLFRNFSLLSAFRLRVEGLDFFFFFGKDVASLESREKVKVEPTVTEREKALPWPARVWQTAKHWDAKDKSLDRFPKNWKSWIFWGSVRGVWGLLGRFWLKGKLFVLVPFDVWKCLGLSNAHLGWSGTTHLPPTSQQTILPWPDIMMGTIRDL